MIDNSIIDTAKILLNPDLIPKYINQLPIMPVFYPQIKNACTDNIYHSYTVDAYEFVQQVLPPPFKPTLVWGFGGICKASPYGEPKYMKSFPGSTFEAIQNIPIHVTFKNNIAGSYKIPVDPTIIFSL